MTREKEAASFVGSVIYNRINAKKLDRDFAKEILFVLKESEDAEAVLEEAFEMIQRGDPLMLKCAETLELLEQMDVLLKLRKGGKEEWKRLTSARSAQ